MPSPLNQIPAGPTGLAERIKALERQVRELQASRRGSNATIGGGDTTITGALIQTAADGRRVVLDADGSIQVYDDSDNLTNYLGGQRGILFNQENFPDGEFVGFFAGNVILGVGNATNDTDTDLGTVGLLGVLGSGDAMVAQSPSNATNPNQMFVIYRSGNTGATPGSIAAPHVENQGDLWVEGAAVRAAGPAAPATWQAVGATGAAAFATGFSAATALGTLTGLPALHYRQDIQDNVILEGGFTAAASGFGTAVVQLPTGYRPLTNSAPIPVVCRSGSTISTAWLYVSGPAGNLNFNSGGLGSTVTASATYFVPRTAIPLRNIA